MSVCRPLCLEVDDIEQTRRRLIENTYEATEKKLGGRYGQLIPAASG